MDKLNPEEMQLDPQNVNEEIEYQQSCLEKSLEYEENFEKQLLLYLQSIEASLGSEVNHLAELMRRHKEQERKMTSLANDLESSKRMNAEYTKKTEEQMKLHYQPLKKAKQKLEDLHLSRDKKKNQLETLKKQLGQLDEHIQILERKYTSIEQSNEKLEKQVLKIQAEARGISETIEDLYLAKKKLNNELQELRGNIRVYCRIRPFLNGEQQEPIHELINENTLKLKVPKQNQRSEKHEKDLLYNFEQIFDMHEKQSNVFDELAQLIQSAIDGKNVCVFTYGQTGSGKTFTMQGGKQKQSKGIIPRSIELIFQEIEKANQYQWKYSISVSIQEVYLETIRDLLQMKNISEENNDKIQVNDPEDIYVLLQEASKNRKVAETNCNEHSSRSHLIFTLHLEAKHNQKKVERRGSLNLVDLAGSERVGLSKVEGERMKETQAINKSLTHLGVVIMAMGRKQQFVPFRNSKLTHLLQKYLQGDSKTLMFVNISPKQSDFHQTLCSLRFAQQVKQCKIKK